MSNTTVDNIRTSGHERERLEAPSAPYSSHLSVCDFSRFHALQSAIDGTVCRTIDPLDLVMDNKFKRGDTTHKKLCERSFGV